MSDETIYQWKRNADDFLQCWPKNSKEFFLQPQASDGFFAEMQNSDLFFKPSRLMYDPLRERFVLNSGVVNIEKSFYQEREGVNFSHMGYVSDGELILKTENEEFLLTKGMFFCTAPFSHYVLQTDQNIWKGFWFHIEISPYMEMRMKSGSLIGKTDYLPQLEFSVDNYLQELRKEDMSYEILDAYAELIEVYIRHTLSKIADKSFAAFIAKIKRNPAMFASTDEAAQSIGITRYELDKLCTKELGMSFAKYLLSEKMNLARKYSSRMCSPISIAKAIGFSDAASFSKAFKTYHNCTFEDFRKVNRYKDNKDFL